MEQFTESVIEIICAIPEGKVMTYGQIARIAGNARGARQVARILHSMSKKYKLPWHRVIGSMGDLRLKADEQKLFLEMEGVEFKNQHTVDLKRYQYHP